MQRRVCLHLCLWGLLVKRGSWNRWARSRWKGEAGGGHHWAQGKPVCSRAGSRKAETTFLGWYLPPLWEVSGKNGSGREWKVFWADRTPFTRNRQTIQVFDGV